MYRFVFLVAAAGCQSATAASSPTTPPEATSASAPVETAQASTARPPDSPGTPLPAPWSAEEAAHELFEAMIASDVERMRAVTLRHDQLTVISTKPIDRVEYDERVEAFLAARAREFEEAPPGVRLVDIAVKERDVLSASETEKLHHDLAFARIAPILEVEGERKEGMPLLFVETSEGYRFSIKN